LFYFLQCFDTVGLVTGRSWIIWIVKTLFDLSVKVVFWIWNCWESTEWELANPGQTAIKWKRLTKHCDHIVPQPIASVKGYNGD